KSYKTCSDCLITKSNNSNKKRTLPISDESESVNNPLKSQLESQLESQFESQLECEIEDIIFTDIIEYVSNKTVGLEQDSSLVFNFRVELNDDILNAANNNMKTLVKLIVDEVEEGDGYHWTFTTGPTISVRHSDVGKYYLAYSQCCELE
ncbi:3012_t:CDS:2, partial [Gigaspora margarita]